MATILRVHPKCGFLTSLVWVLVCVSDILSVGSCCLSLACGRGLVWSLGFAPLFRGFVLVLCRHSWAALLGGTLGSALLGVGFVLFVFCLFVRFCVLYSLGGHSLGGTLGSALLAETCGHESKPIVFVWFLSKSVSVKRFLFC